MDIFKALVSADTQVQVSESVLSQEPLTVNFHASILKRHCPPKTVKTIKKNLKKISVALSDIFLHCELMKCF